MITSFRLAGSARNLRLAAAALLVSSTTFGQLTTLPFHYTMFNPASTGLLNRQEANVSVFAQPFGSNVYTGYMANYQARVSRLHGGLGVTYQRHQHRYGNADLLHLNYSYHIRLGENSTLAAGVSAGLFNEKFSYSDGTNFGNQYLTTNLGVSFKRREFHAGFSVQNPGILQLPQGTLSSDRYSRSFTLFAENTWTLSPSWKLRGSAIISGSGGAVGTVCATFKDRFWFGGSVSPGGYGAMVGYDFKNGMSVGYSFEARYNGISKNSPPVQGLTFRFRLP